MDPLLCRYTYIYFYLLYLHTDYLSINKEQTLKAVALESRSDFVTWMSALRLAKYGGEDLSLAYKNCLVPPTPAATSAGEKDCSLAFLPDCGATGTSGAASKASSFKTKAIMDLHKVKGNQGFSKKLFLEHKLVSQTSINFLELDYVLLATMRHICKLVDIRYYMLTTMNSHSTYMKIQGFPG